MNRASTIIKGIVFTFWCFSTLTTLLFGQLSAEQENERKRTKEILERSENQRASLPKIKRFFGKLTKEQEMRITPSNENVIKYREFLNNSKTGIVKILPDPKCDLRIFDANDLKCAQALPIVGMGSWYSFSEESHIIPFRTDISFTDNNLSVGFTGNLLGLIVQMDDSDINSIDLNNEEIQFLASFSPAKSYSEIKTKQEQFTKGFKVKDKIYSTKALAKLNRTYAMRSINYYKIRYFRWVDYYDDITLVFRIIEIDSEGGLTLIWKELKKDSKVRMSRAFKTVSHQDKVKHL